MELDVWIIGNKVIVAHLIFSNHYPFYPPYASPLGILLRNVELHLIPCKDRIAINNSKLPATVN